MRRLDWDKREIRTGAMLLAPLLAFIGVLVLAPVVGTIIDSFYLDVAFRPRQFVGLRNYAALAMDHGFWQSVRFTLLFIVVSVPLELALGMALAMLLDIKSPLRGVIRACALVPWAVPSAVSARVWELIYNYSYGLANSLLQAAGADGPVNWLGTDLSAFAAVVLADVWKTTPFVAIILLANLQAVAADLMSQARVDRANFWQAFWRVTLPLIRPGIVAALLFRTIDALRVFDLLYILTHGGPGGSTTSMSLYAYKYYLLTDFGYGSAVSVVLFAAALTLSALYVKFGRFRAEAT